MTENQKQNGMGFYVRMLAYALIGLALRAAVLLPLVSLFMCEGWMRALALLCPVLAVLVVLPLRYSFAQTMVRQPRFFSFDTAFSFTRYGEKLKQGLVHALHVIKWGVPTALLLAGAYYCYTTVDALTLFQTIDELGNTCARVLGLSTANHFMLGVGAVGAVLGLGVLIWMWGAARNSASRYLWARAVDAGLEPKTETRRQLKGRRLEQLGVALVNLILWIPFLYVTAGALKAALSDASTMLMMAITTGSLPKMDLIGTAMPVAGAFLALYLPLLPLRRWNTAAFAMRKPRVKAEKKASA